MRKDDLRSHSAKHKRHSEAEENKVILISQRRVRAQQPSSNRESENCHRRPLQENRRDRKPIATTGCDYVFDAEGDVCSEKGDDNDAHPHISECNIAKAGWPKSWPEKVDERLRPDPWSVVACDSHYRASEDKTFSWTVYNTKI